VGGNDLGVVVELHCNGLRCDLDVIQVNGIGYAEEVARCSGVGRSLRVYLLWGFRTNSKSASCFVTCQSSRSRQRTPIRLARMTMNLVALRRVLTLCGLMGAFAMGPEVLIEAATPVADRCVCTGGLGIVTARQLVVASPRGACRCQSMQSGLSVRHVVCHQGCHGGPRDGIGWHLVGGIGISDHACPSSQRPGTAQWRDAQRSDWPTGEQQVNSAWWLIGIGECAQPPIIGMGWLASIRVAMMMRCFAQKSRRQSDLSRGSFSCALRASRSLVFATS
jgi:hypothetical protein